MVAPAYFASMTAKPEQTALITGASAGIGFELAKLFARDGYRLVLVARRKMAMEKLGEELKKLGSPGVTVIVKDLSLLEAPDQLFASTQKSGIHVDVLVNNAGFGGNGPFAKTNLDDELDMMQLNMVALTHLTKLYMAPMLARKRGKIVNIASTAAFQPGPFMAVYYATKAYVLSFSEAIFEELKGSGVTVTCVCPGATHTEFAKRARMEKSKSFDARAMDAPKVAALAYKGIQQGKPLVVTGFANWLGTQLIRIGPRSTVRKAVRKIHEN
ncbi:MAG TPA: SDR family oxidoreductase [Terriglobales bacterium]|nr:SDR family oxidoreductase [Terriglobales bacterium]